MQGLGPASAAGEGSYPGIVRIPPDTALTERAVYPPGVAVGNFDGAYTMATMYKSGVFAGNKVAFVIPKGWVGTWDMKTRFKKIIVNF